MMSFKCKLGEFRDLSFFWNLLGNFVTNTKGFRILFYVVDRLMLINSSVALLAGIECQGPH